jgi:hypothetical protein
MLRGDNPPSKVWRKPALGGETPELCLARASHNDNSVKPTLSAGLVKKRDIHENASLGFPGLLRQRRPAGSDDRMKDTFQRPAAALIGKDEFTQSDPVRPSGFGEHPRAERSNSLRPTT